MKTKLKVGSMFAGVGGICLGLKNAIHPKYMFDIAWANEIDKFACHTYKSNFNHIMLEGDIELILTPKLLPKRIEQLKNEIKSYTKKTGISKLKKQLDLYENQLQTKYYDNLKQKLLSEEIDLLNGGFPCQSFSIAGDRKGLDDIRGTLFLSIIKLINLLGDTHRKPRFILLENVKNLASHDNGRTYHLIKKNLHTTGYTVTECILNTMNYSNLPQNRERMFILGFLNKDDFHNFTLFNNLEKFKIKFDVSKRRQTILNTIDFDNLVNPKYYYTPDKYPNYFNNDNINISKSINELYEFYQIRRGMYIRKNQSSVCPTLTANMGTGGHNVPLIFTNNGIRKLTPDETFRLQGFPVDTSYTLSKSIDNISYSDSHLYKQSGNAVSVPIITLIANELLKVL